MTDTSQFLPNQLGITNDCLYNLKNSAVSSRSYRCSLAPVNKSSFAPQDTIIFAIPSRRSCFLDTTQTYLRLTIKNNDASTGIELDSNGACVINNINIFHGSNLLESVQQYNSLFSYLLDFQMDIGTRVGSSNTLGTSTDTANPRKGLAISASKQLTTCLPVISGVIGTLADKMLPLETADDLRIEIGLESLAASVYASAAISNWSIISAELEVTIVELGEQGMNMVQSVTPFARPVYLHASSYRHYVSTQTQAAGQASYLVPARFASLKSLSVLPRSNASTTAQAAYSLSSRSNPNWNQYYWRVGSLIVPQKPVVLSNSGSTGGYAEAAIEIQKAFHGLNNSMFSGSCPIAVFNASDAADTSIGNGSTITASATGANSHTNGFAISTELESFSNRNDVLLSGINTLGSNVFFEPTTSTAASSNYTINFYAYYDMILILENGLYSVKF